MQEAGTGPGQWDLLHIFFELVKPANLGISPGNKHNSLNLATFIGQVECICWIWNGMWILSYCVLMCTCVPRCRIISWLDQASWSRRLACLELGKSAEILKCVQMRNGASGSVNFLGWVEVYVRITQGSWYLEWHLSLLSTSPSWDPWDFQSISMLHALVSQVIAHLAPTFGWSFASALSVGTCFVRHIIHVPTCQAFTCSFDLVS